MTVSPQAAALLGMPAEEFRRVVDEDLRGQAPLEVSEALRSVAVIGRFLGQMQTVLAVVDGNLAVKEAEVAGIVAKHAKWVASTGKFRAGLQASLLDVVGVLHGQRDEALGRCLALRGVIMTHRSLMLDDGEDSDDADGQLWAVLQQD